MNGENMAGRHADGEQLGHCPPDSDTRRIHGGGNFELRASLVQALDLSVTALQAQGELSVKLARILEQVTRETPSGA